MKLLRTRDEKSSLKVLRLLLAEDLEDDALLVLGALERHGYTPECTRVMDARGFRSALEAGGIDVILCDYSMPGFDALAALEILKKSGLDLPLIVVSGTIGEAVAVESMLQGASDYILKDNLTRLGPAVDREMREAEMRRQKRLYDSLAESQTEVLEMILQGKPLSKILGRILRRVEDLSEGSVSCCIMLANVDATELTLFSDSGLPGGFPEHAGPIPIGHDSVFCGVAAAKGTNVEIERIGDHPDWSAAGSQVEDSGLCSCWAIPVFSSAGDVLGTLHVYHRVPHLPTPEELRWVESAAKFISLALERCRSSDTLHANETLLRIASKAAHIGGWTVDFPDRNVTWSDQVCAIHEVPSGTHPSFEEALDFCTPECRGRLAGAFERCLADGISFDEEIEIVTARGKHVWVRGIGEGIRGNDGRIVRIQGAFQDMTERRKARAVAEMLATSHREAEEASRANESRYLLQRNALIALTNDIPSEGLDLQDVFRHITEVSARTLGVERVSIWRYTENRSSIECLDIYQVSEGRHSSGMRLSVAEYPAYFEALSEQEFLAADDARTDPRTGGFAKEYLHSLGITSMMDVPIQFGSTLNHVLCHEHIGPARQWTPDEKTFAVAVANLISLALESHSREIAQEEVLRSHQRFQSVAAATNDTIWDWNLQTNILWWNDGFANLFGWSAKESETAIDVWVDQIHPEDRERVVKGIYASIEGDVTHWSDEYRFISQDGTVASVRDRGQIIRDSSGKGIRMVGGMTDLTASRAAEAALERSHRALRMLSSCNEMLIRASEEGELLSGACRLAVEIGGYRMAWAGYAMEDERRLILPMAHAGEELGYLSEVVVTWGEDHSSGIGPAGRAVRSGLPVVFDDIQSNPSFSYWLAPASKRGYRSVVCLPLKDHHRVFGVLCLYGAEPYSGSRDEMKLLQDMANDLDFGINNIRAREARQKAQEVVVKVAQAVSDGATSEFFDLLTLNMVEAMGADGGGIGRYDASNHAIDTISLVLDRKLAENLRYDLEGTPCSNVTEGEICVYHHGMRQLFPDDHFLVVHEVEAYAGIPLFRQEGGVAGIMMVFFRDPIQDLELVKSTLKIFAVRAAAELDRRQADARIREQASLLDKAQDAILVRDLQHHITYWNKSAERLYGWTAAEALGSSVEDLLYHDLGSFTRAHEHTLRHGEWVGEMNQRDKDGRDLTIEGRWTLVRDETGQPLSVFAINTDISENRRLEQQFLRAQRLESIGTLAGGIAHDLNNILAPISMAIELLKMRVNDDRSIELLDTVANSAKRGAEMVGQVLSFARGMEGRRIEVHPRHLIQEIETIVRDTFLKKIELEVDAARDLWSIHGDPTQLHQVLLNLCVNARDAIPGAGKISIIADNVAVDGTFAAMNLEADEGPYVRIQVRDTGKGIPADIIDRIFDPFFTTKSVGKGTGLGLSTTMAIVKGHGGFIRTFSRPDEGTLFQIYLPAMPGSESAELTKRDVELPHGNGETILVVDDEDSIRQITRQTLDAFGYKTLLAANGDEAIFLYAAHQASIHAVLTDMMMPGMDGAATIKFLRKIDPDVKIIATSGITANRDLADAAEVKHFLQKPYTAETLLQCLNLVLKESISER